MGTKIPVNAVRAIGERHYLSLSPAEQLGTLREFFKTSASNVADDGLVAEAVYSLADSSYEASDVVDLLLQVVYPRLLSQVKEVPGLWGKHNYEPLMVGARKALVFVVGQMWRMSDFDLSSTSVRAFDFIRAVYNRDIVGLRLLCAGDEMINELGFCGSRNISKAEQEIVDARIRDVSSPNDVLLYEFWLHRCRRSDMERSLAHKFLNAISYKEGVLSHWIRLAFGMDLADRAGMFGNKENDSLLGAVANRMSSATSELRIATDELRQCFVFYAGDHRITNEIWSDEGRLVEILCELPEARVSREEVKESIERNLSRWHQKYPHIRVRVENRQVGWSREF